MVEGSGTFHVGPEEQEAGAGTVIWAPADVPHDVVNLAGYQLSPSGGDDVVSAIAAVVAGARALGSRVILTTIFPLARGPLPDAAAQAAIAVVKAGLRSLAAPGVIVFNGAAVLAGADGYLQPAFAEDELHLSAAGYAALNAALTPLLCTSADEEAVE